MKNELIVLFCILLIVFTGCSSQSSRNKAVSKTTGVKEVIESEIEKADNSQNSNSKENADSYKTEKDYSQKGNETYKGDDIDIDITDLSATMIYTVISNIMMDPDNYLGKTLKIYGKMRSIDDEFTGSTYFACIIQDATACCAQGLEFDLTDEYSYPDDYPEIGDEIVVTGIFEIYEEKGFKYCRLGNAVLN